MKKAISILLAGIMILAAALGLGACAKTETGTSSATDSASAESTAAAVQTPETNAGQTADEGAQASAKALVVYFSVPDDRDNSYVEIDGERLGNTQYMAYVIRENTGADIFRIQPKTPYPTEHNALLAAAQEEIRTNARPEIDGTIDNFDAYDTVFIGYPNWNTDMPYILYTFFDTYDFSGKTIVPFNTHGGSGFSGTRETIAQLEPNASMLEGKSISRNEIEGARQDIIDWLNGIGMLKNAE